VSDNGGRKIIIFYYGGPSPYSLRIGEKGDVDQADEIGIEDPVKAGPKSLLVLLENGGMGRSTALRMLRKFKAEVDRTIADGKVPGVFSCQFDLDDC
jgi:hypothetical protein